MPEKRRKLAAGGPSRKAAQETKAELRIKVLELEKSLALAERKADDYKLQLNIAHQKRREAEDEFEASKIDHANAWEAVEKAFIKGLEGYDEEGNNSTPIICLKRMGMIGNWVFDKRDGVKDVKRNSSEDTRLFWEARVRDPDFHASALKDDGDGNMKYAIKEHHEELNQLRKSYGDAAYEVVCGAHLEVMEWGTGPVLWHGLTNTEAGVNGVLGGCDLKITPRRFYY